MADSTAPFRHATIHCPRCRTTELTSGEMRHCTKCKGSWIPTETLAEHVSTMQAKVDPKLIWHRDDGREPLPCAVCREPMEAARLFEVPVDRCHGHGVWFDKDELAEVLKRSATYIEPKPQVPGQPHDDTVAWVAVDVGGQLAIETAAAATEVTMATAEASAGFFEGVLEAIGGIFSAIDL